jgi:hypothetical protein
VAKSQGKVIYLIYRNDTTALAFLIVMGETQGVWDEPPVRECDFFRAQGSAS